MSGAQSTQGIWIQKCRKPEGKKQFGRLGCRWEDNIKIDLIEI